MAIVPGRKCNELFKNIFSKTSWPNSIKLDTNHCLVKGIQICLDKGQGLFKGEISTKLQK
jgi:hypothetical protein